MTTTLGLDVGGAHLKVALVENATPVEVRQIYCPLWQGIDKLEAALDEAEPLLRRAHVHAVTMTGELSDLFETRAEGVHRLVDHIGGRLGGDVRFWGGRRGFLAAEAAKSHAADVGSTNFLATATLAAARVSRGLLIDMGSTTTDVIALAKGQPAAEGGTDAQRLESGELVYTGLTRTAVMAVADRLPFDGRWQGIVREYYATMADVRRVLADLPDGVDLHATADGRGKSLEESVARLARMLGRDTADGEAGDWRRAARYLADRQIDSILDGCHQVLSRLPELGEIGVVCAGIGASVAAAVATRLECPSVMFGELVGAEGRVAVAATHCAPAVAVAILTEA